MFLWGLCKIAMTYTGMRCDLLISGTPNQLDSSAFDWQQEPYAKNSGSYTSKSNIAVLNESGFLQNFSGKRLVWIPKHLRGVIAASHNGTIAIGSLNGAMTIIKNTCK